MDRKLKLMQVGGRKLADILNKLEALAKPGINLLEIEKEAWVLIRKSGGRASFAQVPGYRWATCLSVNSGLVHGIPKDYELKEGDLLNIDIGLLYKGFHTDNAKSFVIGGNKKSYKEKEQFLKAGRKALKRAIKEAVEGKFVGHISRAIQQTIESKGFFCAQKYTGHGVGDRLHQSPLIPCILNTQIEKTPCLSLGTTIAIEVIYMRGEKGTKVDEDGWTVKTVDNSWAACFEKTVAVGRKKPIILTPW